MRILVASTHPHLVNIPNAPAPPRPRPPDTGGRTLVLCGVVCPRKGQLEVLRRFAALPEAACTGLRLRVAGSLTHD